MDSTRISLRLKKIEPSTIIWTGSEFKLFQLLWHFNLIRIMKCKYYIIEDNWILHYCSELSWIQLNSIQCKRLITTFIEVL